MKYCIGPYIITNTDDGILSSPPNGVIGQIDMRPALDQPSAGASFFVTPDEITLSGDYELLGQGSYIDQVILNQLQQDNWSTKLNLPPLVSSNLLDVLWDSLTIHADPTGLNAVQPLTPTSKGELELHLGGHSLVRKKKFDLEMPEAATVIESLKNQYREIRQETLDGIHEPNTHRKVLDYWGKQFKTKIPQNIFIPNDLPVETPVPHATTFTESFNQADSTTLGPDLTWTETNSDLETVSNQCLAVSAALTFAEGRAEHSVSSNNNYTKIAVYKGATTASTNLNRALCRFQSGARTHYGAGLKADGTYELFYRIAGSATNIASGSQAWSDGDVLECRADGSTISIYLNAGLVRSETDTNVTTGLRGGALNRRSASDVSFDAFEVGDLAAGGLSIPIAAHHYNHNIGSNL